MKTRILLSAMFSTLLLTGLPLATYAQEAAVPPPVLAPVPPLAPQPILVQKLKDANISSSVHELVKMSEAGTDPAVIQSYVDASNIAYVPRPDEIIYMHEHGIPSAVITSMIQHGAKLREQIAQAAPQIAQVPAAPQAQAPSPTYVIQQPAPTYVTTPSYAYSSPNVIYVPYSGSSSYCGGYGGYYGGGYYGGYYPRATFNFRLPLPGFGFPHFSGLGGAFRVGGHFGGHFSGGHWGGHRR